MTLGLRYRSAVIVISVFLSLLVISSVLNVSVSSAVVNPIAKNIANPSESRSYISEHSRKPYIYVPFSAGSISRNASVPYNGTVSVMVTFALSNQSKLKNLLVNLSNPASPEYRKFLTRSQFSLEFGPSKRFYQNAAAYFMSFSGANVSIYSDRISLSVTAPAKTIGIIFNTTVNLTEPEGNIYHASRSPSLPSFIGSRVSEVSGLTNAPSLSIAVTNAQQITSYNLSEKLQSPYGYPQPISSGGTQYIYGSDLQVAYDEPNLLNSLYPTGDVAATILWSGYNSNGVDVGPFVPSDIYDYYNNTLPSGQPHSKVYGVPINGAPPPGSSASTDVSGANVENTLDLEMIGSTAPGSSIYNVYGPSPTTTTVDQAFAYILNPGSQYQQLNNVSVISNSWGAGEYNDTAWYTYLEEAQTRGITVLASSGDSGNNQLNFPSAMAYNYFGMTAVGGTTLVLNSNTGSSNYLHIQSQEAWSGSTGGISPVFSEPSWQRNTEANMVISGAGRGVPDISAIGNNTAITLTVNGAQGLYGVAGTSVSSPVEAGIIAETDATLHNNGESTLGYLNPILYSLGSQQYNKSSLTAGLPFYDVTAGRNSNYQALSGYDLVTGWGSLNAYNFSRYAENALHQYTVSFKESGLPAGENWSLKLNGEYKYSFSDEINYTEFNGTYPFTLTAVPDFVILPESGNVTVSGSNVVIQIGFYKAYKLNFSEVGLPSGTQWYVNLSNTDSGKSTGSSINLFAENGSYSYIVATKNKSFYATGGNFTVGGESLNFTVTFQPFTYPAIFRETGLPNGTQWEINVLNRNYTNTSSSIVIPLQNGSYGYSVSNQLNENFSANGGIFTVDGNATVVRISFQPLYFITFQESGLPADTNWGVYLNNTFRSANSSSLVFREINGTYGFQVGTVPGYYSTAEKGSVNVSGTNAVVTLKFKITTYTINFRAHGLPAGTRWFVNFTSGAGTSGVSSISTDKDNMTVTLPNGTYSYSIATVNKSYSAAGGTFSVNGAGFPQSVYFSLVTYMIKFQETGLPPGTEWNVTLDGNLFHSNMGVLEIWEPNGTYFFNFSSLPGYRAINSSGIVKIDGESANVSIVFSEVVYEFEVTESMLPAGTQWWVNFTNGESFTSNTQNITFSLPNGTYYYYIGSANKTFESPNSYLHYGNGSYILYAQGYSFHYYFSFFPVYYTVTITENGLSSGTDWSGDTINTLNFNYGFDSNTSSATVSFVNGTYTLRFFAYSSNGIYYTQPMLNFTVDGKNVSVNITFQRYYTVTFREIGLPVSQEWGLNISGNSQYSYSGYINVSDINGTYSYRVLNSSSYFSDSGNGNFYVEGSNVTLYVKYSPFSYIWGNLFPSNATLYINGKVITTQNGYFNVSITSGNFRVEVVEIGYKTAYYNFTLAVGQSKNLNIRLSSTSEIPVEQLMLYGGIASAILVGIVTVYYANRKRK